ncbi:YdcF family protein [Xanthobacter sp. AM11]|uniref:YdcF family protein n=1 Tax=Xanthobacter sp. AM11 TaxID=3380643 RepID=UPI0039BF2A21
MDSFFTASKVLWFLVAPSNALVILAGLGLVLYALRARRLGIGLLLLTFAGWVVLGFSPAGNHLLSPLEERFPLFKDDGQPVTGIIMLGGAEVPSVGLARGVPAFADAGERAIAFGALARRYPNARLVFTGGSSALFPNGPALEAQMIRQTLGDLAIAPERVTFEENSRNTAENAAFSRNLLHPRPEERWLLLTSAFHMPRAMGAFRKAGFPVTAYPVDFRTVGPDALDDPFSRAASGLDMTDVAVKEWVGLIAYYLSGKTEALFPAP